MDQPTDNGMNDAQRALLARLREVFDEVPRTGALNAGGRPLRLQRTETAVKDREDDGPRLVEYLRAKVYARPESGYAALVKAGRPELTFEAMVADADAPWASEFTEADREAARQRLGAQLDAHREQLDAEEAEAVERDRAIVAQVSASRVAKGRPALTREQEADMLERRAESRRRKWFIARTRARRVAARTGRDEKVNPDRVVHADRWCQYLVNMPALDVREATPEEIATHRRCPACG